MEGSSFQRRKIGLGLSRLTHSAGSSRQMQFTQMRGLLLGPGWPTFVPVTSHDEDGLEHGPVMCQIHMRYSI
jgi:hypothetical protein